MNSTSWFDRALRLIAPTFVMLCTALGSQSACSTPGQPGTLDATWGGASNGKAITSIGGVDDRAHAMLVQPDGKVLTAGVCISGAHPAFCAARYDNTGLLDPTFGASGKVITAIGSGDAYAFAMALQPDGKVLVVGQCYGVATNFDFCAVRYDASGVLDTTFGTAGKVITAVSGGNDYVSSMALQPDGKLLVAGLCANGTNFDFCVVRYDNFGVLDPAFGSAGKVSTTAGGLQSGARAITLQPDGKIVLAGDCYNGSAYDFCALRFEVNGVLDATFGTAGKVTTSLGGGDDHADAVALQPDGQLLLAGYCAGTTNVDLCALRYDTKGVLDTTFGNVGKVITPMGTGNDYARSVVLQPNGYFLLAGYCDGVADVDFCAVRYDNRGAPDPTFGAAGKVITAIGTSIDNGWAVALQQDGKVLVAGTCNNGSRIDFCSVRYEGGPFGYRQCSLDIDGDGRVLATTDSLIHARIALGITGPAVVNGITFAANATRNTWPLIRTYLVSQCGMLLP